MKNALHTLPTYTTDLEERVAAWAQAKIRPSRLAHVRGVVETAAALAQRYAPHEELRARLAGWIHDTAKHWSDDELLDFARSHNLPLSEGERHTPMLLHGVVGYELANAVFGLNDPALQQACRLHTTGAPGMTILDKIVYLADLIEPTRDFPGVQSLREDAERNLDEAILHATDHTLHHLLDREAYIDPRALALHNALLDAHIAHRKPNSIGNGKNGKH